MRQSTTLALSIIAALALVIPVHAEDAAKKQRKAGAKPSLFQRADANSDGKLTFEEVSAAAPKFTKERFDKVDKNSDGVLTQEEMAAIRQQVEGAAGSRLMAADANQDGKVTLEEITAKAPNFPAERFNKLDANKDGALTQDELSKGAPTAKTQPASATVDPAPAPGDGEKFKQADVDKNGEVTFDEAKAVVPELTQEKFTAMDKNADGVITPDEAPNTSRAPAKGQEPVMQLAKRADVDQDGKVTFEEMSKVAPNMTQERFNQIDTNKDGVLTMEDRAKGGKEGKGGDPAARANAVKKLQSADANGDGKVTFEEALAAKPGYPKEAFDKFDTNKDGVISAEDLPSAK
ncbi:MAG: hypothetical protein WC655_13165 [Candidatus Hydrogenedentales bacterium]|jgi:Ca2+-binding EF-hand superfamily protein